MTSQNTLNLVNVITEEVEQTTIHNQFTPAELRTAFKDAQTNNMPAIETLYQWFLPLVKSISHSYSCYTTLGEDAENICWEQFYIFVKNYKGNDYRRLPGLIKLRLISRMADAANSRRYSDPLVLSYLVVSLIEQGNQRSLRSLW